MKFVCNLSIYMWVVSDYAQIQHAPFNVRGLWGSYLFESIVVQIPWKCGSHAFFGFSYLFI